MIPFSHSCQDNFHLGLSKSCIRTMENQSHMLTTLYRAAECTDTAVSYHFLRQTSM
uniref:Uncharacterized protein n=1 Tax=Anguilla anguilla TaxID=7936 RepID=A0A0E9VG58_ANGAN